MSEPMEKGLYVPLKDDRGNIFYDLKPPKLKRLYGLYGPPPWVIECNVYDIIPDEASDLVGFIEWRGMMFKKVEEES